MNSDFQIREHVDLSPYNTMGLAAKARYFISLKSVDQLKEFIADKIWQENQRWILGGGSNVLFIDDFDGLVVHVDIPGKEVVQESDDLVLLKAGAGENWHELVMFCVDKGWGGIENLSLIPGSVGAAPIQNIGAYGTELVDVFHVLEAVNVETGEIHTFTKNECKFGYRDSIFKQEARGKYVVVSVTLRLQKDPQINTVYKALSEALESKGISTPTIKDVSDTVIEIRRSKLPDPAEIGNTGSFFKNPVISESIFDELKERFPDIPHYSVESGAKIPAAWLIDQCGWKGKRFGDAGVHKMQALVIVNYGEATGSEIWSLAQRIQASVEDKFGISLVPEVNVVGKTA
ncbi:UDP-N-acetylmuramate dehydrogenase [Gracilimonas mengyeensis]|uniref:UDP-N-acetylenolpyruvoylglucosamine reductase n=1 Tax=Gracilimonas mengyeensis TaxID=1302730 RepID=A0A521D4K1_9BACT|nr:UDP-N-acetylmuramate dehydrogenase [Gracilimonas mengyeensis]SMO66607.1 UDP-N-acetylmuramate dehydrogenase [Gracilimonas mengyeensis]